MGREGIWVDEGALSKKSAGRGAFLEVGLGCSGWGTVATGSGSGEVSAASAARASSFVVPSKKFDGRPLVVLDFLCGSYSGSSSSSDSALRFLPFEPETLRRPAVSAGRLTGRGAVSDEVLAS